MSPDPFAPDPYAPPTMPYTKKVGDLFLAVLPLVHYSRAFGGASYEEVMTLLPERSLAAEFSELDVDRYIQTFRDAAEERFGGPVRQFTYTKHATGTGRIFVVVNQYGR